MSKVAIVDRKKSQWTVSMGKVHSEAEICDEHGIPCHVEIQTSLIVRRVCNTSWHLRHKSDQEAMVDTK